MWCFDKKKELLASWKKKSDCANESMIDYTASGIYLSRTNGEVVSRTAATALVVNEVILDGSRSDIRNEGIHDRRPESEKVQDRKDTRHPN